MNKETLAKNYVFTLENIFGTTFLFVSTTRNTNCLMDKICTEVTPKENIVYSYSLLL